MCHPAGVGDILMAMMANWPKSLGVASLLLGAMTLLGTTAAVADSGTAAHAGAHPGANFALLGRCAKCHNSEDWAGGIAFDTLPTDDLAANAEVWEKVVRKLRGRLMPPPNVAQPDQPTIDAFV